jgi:hypothetical protein
MLLESVPLIIPTFNNPTFTRNFVAQSKNVGFKNITIFDNNSTYPPMLILLEELSESCKIVRLDKNFGPHYILRTPDVYESLPTLFCLSDPDVEYSKELPKNFLEILFQISEEFKIGKVGFAMEVPAQDDFINPFMKLDNELWKMEEWEKQFWQKKVGSYSGHDVFEATLDTHFALYNKKYFDPLDRYRALRVAGKLTSKHLGLYKKTEVPKEEEDFYRNSAKYSYLRGKVDGEKNPIIEITVLEYTQLVEAKESLDRNLTRVTLERDYLNQELQKVFSSNSWKMMTIPRNIIKLVRNLLKN